ncbi:glutamate racemase [Leptospira levettii]|uniref:glutamate racemase n=1 Tax=Leptospira levettii TaxID=2023178 RepID=UPI0010832495|nr:glutamate racemase [Leptospira levettii]MCG6148139.1 glutamate racemase [Leptospira levettii]MCW7473424.1 glutamate racemase [Leptospira levettii]MCW7508185.1 glutamate racemase [Leptospira levettii]MCW7519275.1 glutamate racemase [Leptospira levettii]TGK98402.1 glutamate racemase [Leptospira levettii]
MNSRGRYKIGIFDSGLGGLSVLRTLWKETSNIDYIYFGDLVHSPYGQKSKQKVIELSKNAFEYLIEKDCEAVLFACNTATSAAADFLRKQHSIPIFGMEPAIKPALVENPGVKIAVFATELTLKEEKFKNLVTGLTKGSEILPVPCEGLAKLIDSDRWEDAWDFLDAKIKMILPETDIIVLGCTHYVFLRERIHYHYPNLKVYDGNLGTSLHMKKMLQLPDGSKENRNQLDILLNTSESDYVHLAGRIAKTITPNHTLSLINTTIGKLHV